MPIANLEVKRVKKKFLHGSILGSGLSAIWVINTEEKREFNAK